MPGPGAGGAFIVNGAGLLNPTTPTTTTPPAESLAAGPRPAALPLMKTPAKVTGDTVVVKKNPVVRKRRRSCRLCPLNKPKAKYKIVKGKRGEASLASAVLWPKAKAKAKTKAKVTTKAKDASAKSS